MIDVDTVGRMHIVTAMLANGAEATPQGLLNISGGGWTTYSVHGLPGSVMGALAVLVNVDPGDAAILDVKVTSPSGRVQPLGDVPIARLGDETDQLAFVVPFHFAAREFGTHIFEISVENEPLTVIELDVREVVAQL